MQALANELIESRSLGYAHWPEHGNYVFELSA